jgi:hypothetical protein
VIALVAALFGVVGCSCSDQEEPQPKGQCFDYSSWNGATPTVTALELFADAPQSGVIRRACDAMSCHGSDRAPKGRLYLGPPLYDSTQTPIPMIPAEITTVLSSVVLADSHTAPAVKLIVPNDPQNSFLMMKLDGCLDAVKAECTSTQAGALTTNPCGDFMPQTGFPLAAADRDEIRRWISQGAGP